MMRLAMRSGLASVARLISRGFLGGFDTLSPRPEDSISYFNDGEKWKPEAWLTISLCRSSSSATRRGAGPAESHVGRADLAFDFPSRSPYRISAVDHLNSFYFLRTRVITAYQFWVNPFPCVFG
jgi:hypothetical protein